ncbi:MAG: HigA family addiction module antitoxin [Bacteroidota bacterium]
MGRKRTPPHKILVEEFLVPYYMGPQELSVRSGMTMETTEQLIAGQIPVTEEIAAGLSKLFGNTSQFWINLQKNYDAS